MERKHALERTIKHAEEQKVYTPEGEQAARLLALNGADERVQALELERVGMQQRHDEALAEAGRSHAPWDFGGEKAKTELRKTQEPEKEKLAFAERMNALKRAIAEERFQELLNKPGDYGLLLGNTEGRVAAVGPEDVAKARSALTDFGVVDRQITEHQAGGSLDRAQTVAGELVAQGTDRRREDRERSPIRSTARSGRRD